MKPEPAFYITQGDFQFVAVEQSVWDNMMERLYPDGSNEFEWVELYRHDMETRVFNAILATCWREMKDRGMVHSPAWRREPIDSIPLSLFLKVAPEPSYMLRVRNVGKLTIWDVIVEVRRFVPDYGSRYNKPKGR
jgi:hypothetical protein